MGILTSMDVKTKDLIKLKEAEGFIRFMLNPGCVWSKGLRLEGVPMDSMTSPCVWSRCRRCAFYVIGRCAKGLPSGENVEKPVNGNISMSSILETQTRPA